MASQPTRRKTDRTLPILLKAVRACRVCEAHLPFELRQVLLAGTGALLLIVGQATGAPVRASGVPWNDASGEKLRGWMGIDKTTFYDASQIAIIPMGHRYPGRGAGGDLPPWRECPQVLGWGAPERKRPAAVKR